MTTPAPTDEVKITLEELDQRDNDGVRVQRYRKILERLAEYDRLCE